MAATGVTVVTQRSETNQMVVEVEVLLVVLVLVLLVLVLVLVVVVVALLMLVVMVVVVFEGCLTHNVTQSLSSRRGCIVFWPLRGRCRRRIAGSAMNRRSGVAATKLPNDVCSVYQCVGVL
jgi:hypothetical protein